VLVQEKFQGWPWLLAGKELRGVAPGELRMSATICQFHWDSAAAFETLRSKIVADVFRTILGGRATPD
jgi:hypothetical protein